MLHKSKVMLDMAIDAYATAEGEAKEVAERALTRATIIEMLQRQRHMGNSSDMLCGCGAIKSNGITCLRCRRYREAIYGGDNWVLYGVCRSSLC
jgi:hypothetical protein